MESMVRDLNTDMDTTELAINNMA